MSFDDFRKTGKMGCSNCYRIFGDRLKPIMKRLHGNTEHVGKAPARYAAEETAARRETAPSRPETVTVPAPEESGGMKEIESLKLSLEKAIGAEEYEKAAELRDRIRQLEGAK